MSINTIHTCNGGTDYGITFPYLHEDDITVYVNGRAAQKSLEWVQLDETTIQFIKPYIPTNLSAVIEIRRDTKFPPDVVFTNNSMLSPETIDLAFTQIQYLVEESKFYYDYIAQLSVINADSTFNGAFILDGSTFYVENSLIQRREAFTSPF